MIAREILGRAREGKGVVEVCLMAVRSRGRRKGLRGKL